MEIERWEQAANAHNAGQVETKQRKPLQKICVFLRHWGIVNGRLQHGHLEKTNDNLAQGKGHGQAGMPPGPPAKNQFETSPPFTPMALHPY
jgi:hypothetical protein